MVGVNTPYRKLCMWREVQLAACFILQKRWICYNSTIYSFISSWIKRKIISSLLWSIGLCLRGSRSIRENENIVKSIENDAVVSEGLTKITF